MPLPYAYIPNLQDAIDIPADGTLSRTIYSDDDVKVLLFGFDAGQELSEHTASRPAIVQILQGEARLSLGKETFEARAGSWAHMQAGLPHSVLAITPLIMQLVLLPPSEAGSPD